MITNDYLRKVYKYPPCWQLVADVYVNELSCNVANYKPESSNTRSIADAFRLALHNSEISFEKTENPSDYDVVLMGATYKLGVHHCGIYYKGKVLHAIDSGNLYETLSTIKDRYKIVEYWKYKSKV